MNNLHATGRTIIGEIGGDRAHVKSAPCRCSRYDMGSSGFLSGNWTQRDDARRL